MPFNLGPETFIGTDNADTFVKIGFGNLYAEGRGGADRIDGSGGQDTILGQDGQDSLFGQNGQDLLFGGNSEDYLNGGRGSDVLHGEDGGDRLWGGDQADRLYGENGDDTLEYLTSTHVANGTNRALQGDDTLVGADGDDDFIFTAFTAAQMNLEDNGDGTFTAHLFTGADVLIDPGSGADQLFLADAVIDLG